MDLYPIIEKSRKNLKKSSIQNYIRNINILNDKVPYENLNFLKEVDNIQDKLNDKKDTTKRNFYTSIVVALNAVDKDKYKKTIDKYQDILKEMSDKINSNYEKNEKTEKEKNNWLTYEELNEIREDYKKKIKDLNLNKKEVITPKENKLLLYYLISALYTLNSPLRLDWATLKYVTTKKELDKENNFILDLGKYTKIIYLNDFKNVKKIKAQNFKLDRELSKIINLYRKFNKGKYLLMNTRNFKMSQNSLSKMLPLVFKKDGKSVNLNMIRKAKIASEIDIEQLKKEEELAQSMLHSSETQKEIYLKND